MNHLHRFRALIACEPVDRLPCIEGASWCNQVPDRRRTEGLSADDRYDICRNFDPDVYYRHWFGALGPEAPRPGCYGAGILAEEPGCHRLRPLLCPDSAPATWAIGRRAAMEARLDRLGPVVRGGGFFPSVDHQTPPDAEVAHAG